MSDEHNDTMDAAAAAECSEVTDLPEDASVTRDADIQGKVLSSSNALY